MVDVLPSGLSGLSGLNTTGAWQNSVAVAPPGTSAAGLFALYPSLGDKTIATATNIDTVQDGPMKVTRYGALTVNAALTVTQRCRGHIILCDSLVMGAAADISMTGRGAKGAANWPVVDLTIPQSVALAASKISQRDVLNYITQNGIWIGDPVFWAFPDADVADCRASITAGSVVLLSAAGCGAGGASQTLAAGAGSVGLGSAGNAGANGGTGGGAGGGAYAISYPSGAPGGGAGYPWGGGSAAGYVGGSSFPSGDSASSPEPGLYGGRGGAAYGLLTAGGAAGNPGGAGAAGYGGAAAVGGDGTGGVLIIICRGNVTRNATDLIQANGMPGGAVTGTAASTYNVGGSGSGGGHVSIIYGGTYTGTGTTQANGGAGGACSGSGTNYVGSAGGAGSVVTKTFAQMGW